jgi:hypothetical protein
MKLRQVRSRYQREMIVSFIVYGALLMASIRYGRPMPDGLLRTIVLLSPMAGFLGMIRAIARHVDGIDEYQRKFLLETFALAAALTAALTFSYGFLETAGYPKISMFSVWMILCGAWGVVAIARVALKK